jgi:hypothetical protein
MRSLITRTAAVVVSTMLLAPAAAVVTVPAAGAAPSVSWGPSRTLAAYAWHPSVAVDPAGTATVVYAQHWWRGPVWATQRPAGGTWTEPVRIGRGTAPEVGVDAAGDLTAIWQTNRRGFTTGVASASKPTGGAWQQPTRLTRDREVRGYGPGSPEGTFGAAALDLAVGPGGETLASWEWGSYDRNRPLRVQAAFRPLGGAWETGPVPVTGADWSGHPVVTVDGAGDATVVFSRALDRAGEPLWVRRRDHGGAWSAPTLLSRNGSAQTVAAAPDGTVVVAFSRGLRTVQARVRPPGGPWAGVETLSSPDAGADELQLALDGSGDASVLWTRSEGAVELVQRPAGGAWTAPTRLAGRRDGGFGARLDLNAAGDALAVWGTWGLWGRYAPAGGGWSDLLAVTRRNAFVDEREVAVYPNGDALVVWLNESHRLKARRLLAG